MARISVPSPNIRIGIDGFEGHDVIGRTASANRLSDLVERIDEPLVIALDGPWGSGKSFFLRCWTGAHMQSFPDSKVIYVDAFESDYLTDPLVALVAAIDRYVVPVTEAQISGLDRIKRAVGKLWRPAARIAVAGGAGLAAAAVATPLAVGPAAMAGGAAVDAISAAADEVNNTLDVVDEADNIRLAMTSFREGLRVLTSPNLEGGPPRKLILVIDELDRCRPDYALSLIEIAKHFFAVDGVHFVLGANFSELENSVRARYGAGINAQRYLQKFVSFSLALPDHVGAQEDETAAARYLNYAAPLMGMNPDVTNHLRLYIQVPGLRAKITPRDVQHILRALTLMPGGPTRLGQIDLGYLIVQIGLAVMKVVEPGLFGKAKTGAISVQEITEAHYTGKPLPAQEVFLEAAENAWTAVMHGEEVIGEKWRGRLFKWNPPRDADGLPALLRRCFSDIEVPQDLPVAAPAA